MLRVDFYTVSLDKEARQPFFFIESQNKLAYFKILLFLGAFNNRQRLLEPYFLHYLYKINNSRCWD